mgnify:CR=1 FL=1
MIKIPFLNKKKNAPQFYKDYALGFENQKTLSLEEIRFVVFDTETTGLDVRQDRMLSIGAVSMQGNSINIADNLEIYLSQDVFKTESVAIHGILKHGKYIQVTEEEAVKTFLNYIGNSILVGHHVGFDVAMINYALKRLGAPKLKNIALDTGVLYKRTIHVVNIMQRDKNYSLDELCKELKIDKEDRHKAAGDAFITALAFLKIQSKLRTAGVTTLKQLLRKVP